MTQAYYQIQLKELNPEATFNVKAVRFCMCCQQIVDQVGSGEGFICQPCKLILDTGILASIFSEVKHIMKQSSGELPTVSYRL